MKGVNEGKEGRKKKRKETKEGKVKEENQGGKCACELMLCE